MLGVLKKTTVVGPWSTWATLPFKTTDKGRDPAALSRGIATPLFLTGVTVTYRSVGKVSSSFLR